MLRLLEEGFNHFIPFRGDSKGEAVNVNGSKEEDGLFA